MFMLSDSHVFSWVVWVSVWLEPAFQVTRMDRKEDQEHWRAARRSFIGFNTRVQGWNWRIPAHSQRIFRNVQYHISVYRRCSVSVQTAQFLWYFKPVLHPSVDYCGLSVLFELFACRAIKYGRTHCYGNKKLHTQEDKREQDCLFTALILSFLSSFLVLPCCGGTNCESHRRAKAGDDEHEKKQQKFDLLWVIKLHSIKC